MTPAPESSSAVWWQVTGPLAGPPRPRPCQCGDGECGRTVWEMGDVIPAAILRAVR
jgi:hypothetical protein